MFSDFFIENRKWNPIIYVLKVYLFHDLYFEYIVEEIIKFK